MAAAGLLGELACPSAEGETKQILWFIFGIFFPFFLSPSFLLRVRTKLFLGWSFFDSFFFPGKAASKEVVVRGGRLAGGSLLVLLLNGVVSEAWAC